MPRADKRQLERSAPVVFCPSPQPLDYARRGHGTVTTTNAALRRKASFGNVLMTAVERGLADISC